MSKCWIYIFLSAWTPRRQCAYVSQPDKNVCLKKAFCQGLVSGFHVGWASSFEVLTLIDWVHNIFESLVPRCELSVCLDGVALLPEYLFAWLLECLYFLNASIPEPYVLKSVHVPRVSRIHLHHSCEYLDLFLQIFGCWLCLVCLYDCFLEWQFAPGSWWHWMHAIPSIKQ